RSPGEKVLAQGWVKTRRDGKNVHFIQLNDGSSPVDLQVVLDAGVVASEMVARITTGACLSVEGELVASPGKGQAVELKASSLTLHGAANPEDYPLQKKKHTLETLRAIGHVSTFGPTFRAENSNTPRHLAEFYMVEPEMAFCDLRDDQDLAEAFLKSQVEQVLSACRPDLEFLSKWYDPDLFKNLEGL